MPTLKKRIIFVIILLFILALVRQSNTEDKSIFLESIDRYISQVYSPFQKAWFYLSNQAFGFWSDYIWLVNLNKENQRLITENSNLSIKNYELEQKNQELKSLLSHVELIQDSHLEWKKAFVLSYDPSFRNHIVWISIGAEQGVRNNSPVIASDGLVGRVIKVTRQSSQVLLLSDENFKVSVLDKKTRIKAIVRGKGSYLELERFPLLSQIEYLDRDFKFEEKSEFLTSGLGRIYPPGIPVGFIDHSNNQDSQTIIPYVDLSKLEEVLVINPYQDSHDISNSL